MKVHVLFFGVLKDLAGRSSDELTMSEFATAGDVIEHYQNQIAGFRQIVHSIAVSVNQEYSTLEARLRPGDEIALLPPVSGGSPDSDTANVRLTRARIEIFEISERVKRPENGAVVIFEGIVRNHTRGRRTLFLDYEAYEEMALRQMLALAAEAPKKFQIDEIAIVHRLGRLEIGETSVLIVVASAHRAAAFDACRWLIDTLKKTVPIWKKEHFADGAVWADGEPFPEQLTAGTILRGPASK